MAIPTRRVAIFTTVYNGKICAINKAFPLHELKPNQFEITEEEFKLIGNVENLERAEELIKSLKKRIKGLK